jgi:3-oxoacyl-[acyl-carrier-protein] synthase-1
MAVASCLGLGKAATVHGLFAEPGGRLRPGPGSARPVGAIEAELPPLPAALAGWNSRNNRLLMALADEIGDEIAAAAGRYGRHRVAVVIGTSTSGIAEGEAAVAYRQRHGAWPAGYHYRQQETGSGAAFLARRLGLSGPAYVLATACSSGAKVFAAARRLIALGLADAAVVGAADTLCGLTLAGFQSLESLAREPCRPFSVHRDGITIGEGGALFLMAPEPAEIALLGVGETSDAHHISAPDPAGTGARAAMSQALADAGLTAAQIAWLNLHGTATPLNDAMESRAVAALFGTGLPCSSTKAMTGHTLGAAGAVEAALVWLTLARPWNPEGLIPPHLWDGAVDAELAPLTLATSGSRLPEGTRLAAMSNSFAFGGSNCSLILGRGWP